MQTSFDKVKAKEIESLWGDKGGMPRPKKLSGLFLCLGTGKAAPDRRLETLLRSEDGGSAAMK